MARTKEDPAPTAEEKIEAPPSKSGLKGLAQEALGASGGKPVRVGAGLVRRLGYEFFVKGKPQTSMQPAGLTLQEHAQSLFAVGNHQLNPAYEIEIGENGDRKTLTLGTYHTKRVHGSAPDLEKGSFVDVYATPSNSESGVAFTYVPVKKASVQ